MPPSSFPKPKLLPPKLRHIRQSLSLTQNALLKKLGFGGVRGMNSSTVSTFETGKAEPPLLVLLAYARLAGVGVDALLDDGVEVTDFMRVGATSSDAAEGDAPKLFRGVPYTELSAEEIEKESSAFTCPMCKARVQFMVRVKVYGVREALTADEHDELHGRKTVKGPSDHEREVIELAKSEGVIEALRQAVEASSTSRPRDIEQFFITFLNSATRTSTPEFALRQCLVDKADARGKLELYTLNGIGAVLADGAFRVFMPTDLIHGRTVKRLGVAGGRPVTKETASLEVWVKTRYGYVVGRGAYMSELRRKSHGDFAKASS